MVQARVFLDGFHNNRISSMAIILESETWTQAQVLPFFSSHLVAASGVCAADLFVGGRRLQMNSNKSRQT
jgi:hypothetical protein